MRLLMVVVTMFVIVAVMMVLHAAAMRIRGRISFLAALQSVEAHPRLHRRDAPPRRPLRGERPAPDRQRPKPALDVRERHAEIEQRAEEHVAGGSRKRLDEEESHGRAFLGRISTGAPTGMPSSLAAFPSRTPISRWPVLPKYARTSPAATSP
jgi:hypothetical protein